MMLGQLALHDTKIGMDHLVCECVLHLLGRVHHTAVKANMAILVAISPCCAHILRVAPHDRELWELVVKDLCIEGLENNLFHLDTNSPISHSLRGEPRE